jgi:hypothetical protein
LKGQASRFRKKAGGASYVTKTYSSCQQYLYQLTLTSVVLLGGDNTHNAIEFREETEKQYGTKSGSQSSRKKATYKVTELALFSELI